MAATPRGPSFGRRVAAVLWRNRSTKGRVLVVVAALLLIGLANADADRSDGDERSERGTDSAPRTVVDPEPAPTVAGTSITTAVPPTPAPTSVAPPTPAPTTTAPALRVAEVVDGDTIVLSNGERVRLIGIDAPERGACGYGEATDRLRGLVGGGAVTLVPGARDDRDRYSRLLRYVEVDGVDVGLEMVRGGWAIARYDSRDGYGRHAREDQYVAADAAGGPAFSCRSATATSPPPVAPSVVPLVPQVPASGDGPDPRFRTCKDAIAAGYGPYVRGVDPEYAWYRDGDGDGVTCER